GRPAGGHSGDGGIRGHARPADRRPRGRAVAAGGSERLDDRAAYPRGAPPGPAGPDGSRMSAFGERATLIGYTAGWTAVRHLPERAAYRTFRRIADAAWRRRGPGVQRLESNLARAIGTEDEEKLRAISRAGMRSYLRYWCEALRLPDWDRDRIVTRVRTEGEHNLRDPLAAGRGVVAALPHMGNWDHAGAWGCLTGAPVTTVAERLKPDALYERFLGFRE